MNRTKVRRYAILITGPAGALSGGDIHALRLAESWAREGRGSIVLVGPVGLAPFIPVDAGIRHVVVRSPFDGAMRTNPVALTVGLAWRGLAAIRHCRDSATVVASSHLIFDVFPASIAHRLWRTPVVSFVYHLIGDSGRAPGLRSGLATRLEQISLTLLRRSGATVFVDNDETFEALRSFGFRDGDLHRTSNAYDSSVTVPDPTPDDPPRLLFIGRLVERKGVWDVLELASRLKAVGSNVVIDIVGDGPLRSPLERRAATGRLDNVVIHGFVDEEQKWDLLSRASLLLAPSFEEGWGIAVGEGLLAGVPVIARELPAYEHFGDRIVTTLNDDFVLRAFELINDRSRLADLAASTRMRRDTLPRWSDVVSKDIRIIERRAVPECV